MRKIQSCILNGLLALALFAPADSVCDEIVPPEAAVAVDASAPAEPQPVTQTPGDTAGKVEPLWTDILQAHGEGDLKRVNDLVFQLDELRTRLGYSNFERFSTVLLSFSQREIDRQNKEAAAFYLRKALQLSPAVPALLFQAGRLAAKIGTTEIKGLYWTGFMSGISQRQVLFSALVGLVYPLLWALTFGFLAAALLYLAVSTPRLLRSISTFLPTRLRGFITFPLVLAAFVAPLWFGPLWCVGFWSVLAIAASAERQWLAFAGGSLLCLWGSLIPIRELGAAWLSDAGVDAMLRVSSGVYQPGDDERLRKLIEEQPASAPANLALGQTLMRKGEYGEARIFFTRAGVEVGEQTVRHYNALLAFLEGDTQGADKTFTALESEGMSSAAFYFNFSKIRFDALETAVSRDLFDKANAIDPKYMQELQSAEERIGFKTPVTLAYEKIPLMAVLRSSLISSSRSTGQIAARSLAVSGHPNPNIILGAGAALLLLFFLCTAKKRLQRGAGYYAGYRRSPVLYGTIRLIPAGAFALRNEPGRCFVLCSFIALLLLPLLEWPSETRHLIHVIQGFELHYTLAVWFLVAACSYIGFYAYEED